MTRIKTAGTYSWVFCDYGTPVIIADSELGAFVPGLPPKISVSIHSYQIPTFVETPLTQWNPPFVLGLVGDAVGKSFVKIGL